ncbi:DUF445 domain-containing protein [Pseudoneobacillus sp. C159]
MSRKTKGSKKIARISLIIMGIGFVATIPFQGTFWVDLLQGGFEAGLVGGLADWFAVTALFRHPLGIPIPHTALLPKNRKRMTNALVSMLKNNWLSKESIQNKINQIHFTDKLLTILEKELQKEHFRMTMIKLLKKLITMIDIEKLTPVIKKQLISSLSNIEMSKFLALASSQLVHEQFDRKALDFLLKKAEVWLNQEQTSYKLGSVSMNVLNKIELDGILQFALKSLQNILNEEKLGKIIKNLLLNVVNSLKHEGDPNREALIIYIQKEIQGLNDNEQLVNGLENWKNQLIAKWEPDQTITDSLQQIQQNALEFIEGEDFIDTYLMPVLSRILDTLKEKEEELDLWIKKQITTLVENNHELIGNLVQENLDKLDNKTLIDMMENNIGKDLQWIRVNGAVCGFIIGIFLTLIHALTRLA